MVLRAVMPGQQPAHSASRTVLMPGRDEDPQAGPALSTHW